MGQLLVLYRFSVDENRLAFKDAYRSQKEALAQIPGHLSEVLVHSTADPSSYMIVSTWESARFFDWLQSSSHATVVDMLNKYKRADTNISRYTIMDTFEKQHHVY